MDECPAYSVIIKNSRMIVEATKNHITILLCINNREKSPNS